MTIIGKQKIFDAIAKRKKIRIEYSDREGVKTTRIIHPYHLFRWNRKIYFIGFCEYDKDIRNFRISRIKGLHTTSDNFRGPIHEFDYYKSKGHFCVFSGRYNIKKMYDSREDQLNNVTQATCPLPPPQKVIRADAADRKVSFSKRSFVPSVDYPIQYIAPKLCNGPASCRSPVEEDILNYLDSEDTVYRYWIEPIKIPFISGGKKHTYTPDVMAEYRDKSRVLIEVKSFRDINDSANLRKYEVGQNYCDGQINLDFEIWTSDNGRIKKFKLSNIQTEQFMRSVKNDSGYNDRHSIWARIIRYLKELMS